jgi:hypothetical protein
LEENLQGVRFNREQRKVALVAYADDTTILVTAAEDIERLKETVQCYEGATGVRLNVRKSQALAVGTWDITRSVMGIPYSEVVTILGFQMASEIETSRTISWSKVTASVKKQASEAYQRELGLSQRILYSHATFLRKYGIQLKCSPSRRFAHNK